MKLSPRNINQFLLVSASALGLAACASTPVPIEQMAVTKAAVANAQTAGGTQAAPFEMNLATEKLAKANIAIANKQYEIARELALEAQVDARLAQIKSGSAKAQTAAAELEAASRALSEEMNRRLK